MKKILLLALAFVLILALCAGCNNNGGDDDTGLGDVTAGDDDAAGGGITAGDDDDAGGGDITAGGDDVTGDDDATGGDSGGSVEWPAELPAYPDGTIKSVTEVGGGNFIIEIDNTSLASLEKYSDAMTKAGWNNYFSSGGSMALAKGDRNVVMTLKPDNTSLTIELGDEVGVADDAPKVWPTEQLPSGFPEYPEGEIASVRTKDDGSVTIAISGTSATAKDAYKDTLEKAGWDFRAQTDSGAWFGKKDGKSILMMYHESTQRVTIDVK